MSATLHLLPHGTDKTEEVLSILRAVADSRGDLPRIWVLLATGRQELRFRQRLIDDDLAASVYCNIEFFNFYSLNARLLKRAGQPVRRLNHLMRFGLLRHLSQQMLMAGELRYFHRIADTRGFVSVLAELFDELKQSRVEVEAFAAAAKNDKDRDIAAIYRRYQALLRSSDLVDLEGEGWLALARLQRQPEIVGDVDLLLVDGYDQFTLVQAQTLAALARGVKHAHITLTASSNSGLDNPHARSRLARKNLSDAFAMAELNLDLRHVEATIGTRHPDLEQLGQKIFGDTPVQASSGAIQLIAMPDPAEEVKAVLRVVKKQLLAQVPPDNILIALRDWERYAPYFETGRQEYELPLLMHYQPVYANTPVIAALIDLLNLAPRFRRRDLLDVIRSPYFDTGLTPEAIDLLDRISLEQQFLGGGAADWLEIIDLARHLSLGENDDTRLTSLTAAQADDLHLRLEVFFAGVRPPEHAMLSDYIQWLADLLGSDPRAAPDELHQTLDEQAFSLKIIRRAWRHERTNPEIVRRDISALDGLKRILCDMQASDDVLHMTVGASAKLDREKFNSDLVYALETEADPLFSTPRTGQVLVTTATEARGLPHPHVYILGLSDAVFPAALVEDPLYLDSEREAMQGRGIPMATQVERIDDQGLFLELISLPRRSLTLSRPAYQAGKVWLESHLWRAVTNVFPDLPIESRLVGSTIYPEQAANASELMLAIADQLNTSDAAQAEMGLCARNWLRSRADHSAAWCRIERGRRVELGRLSFAHFDKYSGVLSHPALLDELTHRLGEDRVWSASQLKDFGLCAFRFFAKRLLKLEEIAEPEKGMGSIQLGAIYHKILEETYRKIRSRGLDIDAVNQDTALGILAAVADDILPQAPDRFKFRETSTWTEEMQLHQKRLEGLIKHDFSSDSPLRAFGQPRHVYRQEEFYDEVLISIEAGMTPLRVNARIDRIDNADGKLIVVDYKSGSTPINRREMEIGRDFQMMIYMRTLISEFEDMGADEDVAGGLFWHLRNLKVSGVFETENEEDIAAIETARAHIAQNLKMGRAGQFPVHATELENGKCSRYCEFSHLCRMNVTNRSKMPPAMPEPTEN